VYPITTNAVPNSILVSRAVCPNEVEHNQPRIGSVTLRRGYTPLERDRSESGPHREWRRPREIDATPEALERAARRLAQTIRELAPAGATVQCNDRVILPYLVATLGGAQSSAPAMSYYAIVHTGRGDRRIKSYYRSLESARRDLREVHMDGRVTDLRIVACPTRAAAIAADISDSSLEVVA
jgi:hypothetical protein